MHAVDVAGRRASSSGPQWPKYCQSYYYQVALASGIVGNQALQRQDAIDCFLATCFIPNPHKRWNMTAMPRVALLRLAGRGWAGARTTL